MCCTLCEKRTVVGALLLRLVLVLALALAGAEIFLVEGVGFLGAAALDLVVFAEAGLVELFFVAAGVAADVEGAAVFLVAVFWVMLDVKVKVCLMRTLVVVTGAAGFVADSFLASFTGPEGPDGCQMSQRSNVTR